MQRHGIAVDPKSLIIILHFAKADLHLRILRKPTLVLQPQRYGIELRAFMAPRLNIGQVGKETHRILRPQVETGIALAVGYDRTVVRSDQLIVHKHLFGIQQM